MSQVWNILSVAFEKYPMVFLSIALLFIVIVIAVGFVMYRILLLPKFVKQNSLNNEIKDIAKNNTERIIDIKDDLNVKHYEMKSDMKEFFHSMSVQSEKVVQALVGGVTDQIKHMNENNEKGHDLLFDKVNELKEGFHSNESRIKLVEHRIDYIHGKQV